MKQFKIINYRYGIFSNIPLEDFIEQVVTDFPDYELFQVVKNSWATMGQEYHELMLVLRLK